MTAQLRPVYRHKRPRHRWFWDGDPCRWNYLIHLQAIGRAA